MPAAGEPLGADQLPEFARRRDEMLRALVDRVPSGQAAVELARVSSAAP
jgi:hypothetical protein